MQRNKKRDYGTGLSDEFCEIFNNTLFTEYLWTVASLDLIMLMAIVRRTDSQQSQYYQH